MEGVFHVIRNKQQLDYAIESVKNCPVNSNKPWMMQLKEYSETRSEAQNRLAFRWYSEASEQGGEYTRSQIRAISKHKFGIPILLAENEKFAKSWKVVVNNCNHEQQIDFIESTELPVTRIMTVKQMAQYLTDFHRVLGSKYKLTDPALYGLDDR